MNRRVYRPNPRRLDRKSTRLNSTHKPTSYAVLCLKKNTPPPPPPPPPLWFVSHSHFPTLRSDDLPSEGGFGAEGEATEGGLTADGEPGGWQGPTFEREDGGGLKGDFFAPQKAFTLGAFGGADPNAGDGGVGPSDPLAEFFGEFLGPEGALGEAGLDDGPSLVEGVQAFFAPNQAGGFQPAALFDNGTCIGLDIFEGLDPPIWASDFNDISLGGCA